MAKLWQDILLPVVVASAVAAQAVGPEISRASRLHAWMPQNVRDSVSHARTDSLKPAPDSTQAHVADSVKHLADSLRKEEEEYFFFGDEPEDTVPKISARDTMKVPDSLRITDPFLYQWYVATRDGYTHKVVVDSLKAEGDTLLWPRIDSLYRADSTLQARLAWEKQWASMSKAERKRWTYEHVQLPILMHRQDSILHRKDSLKHIRDSIIQNTPRILETPYLPDSMLYKRMVTWHHDPMFNRMETFEWDTTANYHFYDYPFMRKDVGASWLGMPGSAVQSYNFFRRGEETSPSFYAPMESWTYTPESLAQFNTKTPYTELEYFGNNPLSSNNLHSDNYRVFTTQNILPRLNIALEIKRYGGFGTLQNEKTSNHTFFVAGNWLGKKYLAHGGFIGNIVTRQESGGMQDNMWVRDTTVDVREIAVNLAAANNTYRKYTAFYNQSYRIPFTFIEQLRHKGDSTWVASEAEDTDLTTAFVGSSTEFSLYAKKYVDNTSTDLSNFYNGMFFINPSKSVDSLRNMRLENRVFLRLQPWHEEAIVSKVEGGIGDRFQTFYLQSPNEVLYRQSTHRWNTLYAYAGIEGQLSRYFAWDAFGQYNFAGAEVNDFIIRANAKLNFFPFRRQPDSPISLKAQFETSLKTPDFYQQHFYSNHYRWENSFGKISSTKVQASLEIPKWKLKAYAGYALQANQVYYDTLGIVRQHKEPISVISAGLSHHMVLGPAHLENAALFQFSSKQEVLPLPTLALNLRWYLQFNVVDPSVLKFQVGIHARYTTLWYAPSYNPVAGVFTTQNQIRYGNDIIFDPFINLQWKKCCIFVKYENAGRGWPMKAHDYFTAHHYIQTAPVIKVGISWPFYPRMGEAKTLSARAGSGFGGGAAGGGGLSSLKNGLSSGGR